MDMLNIEPLMKTFVQNALKRKVTFGVLNLRQDTDLNFYYNVSCRIVGLLVAPTFGMDTLSIFIMK